MNLPMLAIMASDKLSTLTAMITSRNSALGRVQASIIPVFSSGSLPTPDKWDPAMEPGPVLFAGLIKCPPAVNIVATLANGGQGRQSIIDKSTDKDGKDTTPRPVITLRVVLPASLT